MVVDRRFLWGGVLLVIFGFIMAYASSPNYSLIPKTGNVSTIYVKPGGMSVETLNLNSSGIIETSYISSGSVNFYLLNETAFEHVSQNLNSSDVGSEINSLNYYGVLSVLENSTAGMYPYSNSTEISNLTKPMYQNPYSIIGPGNYYAIYYNPSNTAIQVNFYSTAIPLENNPSQNVNVSGSIMAALLVMVGIVVAILSIFRTKNKPVTADDANKLYDKIGNKDTKKQRSKTRSK